MSNQKIEKNDIHFIVGFSRSGTTWLCRTLNSHSKICSFGETSFWGRNFLNKNIYNTNDLQKLQDVFKHADLNNGISDKKSNIIYDNIRLTLESLKNENHVLVEELFLRLCDSLCKHFQKKIAVEKTPHHLNHIDRIREFYPNSKIIALERDIIGFYKSYKNLKNIQSTKEKRKLEAVFHPIGVLLVYRNYRYHYDLLDNYENIMKISYEDILSSDYEILFNVQKYLGLDYEEISLPRLNSSRSSNLFQELNFEDRIWIKLFGHQIKLFESKEDYFIFPICFFLSILKIPIWTISVLLELSGSSGANPFSYVKNLLMRQENV